MTCTSHLPHQGLKVVLNAWTLKIKSWLDSYISSDTSKLCELQIVLEKYPNLSFYISNVEVVNT